MNASTSITCVKPSGTLSQLVDSSSGMHPRHAQYYIRRVRISATDPLSKRSAIKESHVIRKSDKLRKRRTFVFEFPVEAPSGSIYKDDITAFEQLEHWKIVKKISPT